MKLPKGTDENVLKLLAKGPLSVQTLCQKLGVGENGMRGVLGRLSKAGKITSQGTRPKLYSLNVGDKAVAAAVREAVTESHEAEVEIERVAEAASNDGKKKPKQGAKKTPSSARRKTEGAKTEAPTEAPAPQAEMSPAAPEQSEVDQILADIQGALTRLGQWARGVADSASKLNEIKKTLGM